MTPTKRLRGRPALGADKRTDAAKVSLNAAERILLDADRGDMPAGRYLRELWLKHRSTSER